MFACLRRPVWSASLAIMTATLWGASSGEASQLAVKVNGWTSPPVGYVEFCRTTPQECAVHGDELAQTLSERRWRELEEVNAFVNHIVIPATDRDFYKSEEVWALPETYGDCEDYVLLKRKWLVDRGWPTGSLLVSVVFDEVMEGHAVLLARTSRGDFVLDNKTDTIRAWYDTAYRFVKRQSVEDPNRWVSLGDPRWTTQSTAAPR